MKFLHLADLHVGKSLGDFDLLDDQAYILKQILDVAAAHSVDALLIAGDVYDKSIPSEGAVALFDDFLRSAVSAGLKVFLISGNHDSDERLQFGSALFSASGVYVAGKYDGSVPTVTLTDDCGPLHVRLLPFVKASQVRHFFPDAAITTYEDAVRQALSVCGLVPGERNILLAHQFVTGQEGSPTLGGSEGMSAKNVGTVEMIGSHVFRGFDYVALGHIHAPQAVGSEFVRYAGSPLKYSLSEVGSVKSLPLITMGKKGDVSVELIPLVPRRDVRQIKGELLRLLAPEHVVDPEDYMFVTLTDEDVVSDAAGILRRIYPNVVQIRYENSHTRELTQPEAAPLTERQSFPELVADFYRQVYGAEITEEEMKVMLDVAGEAGVYREAD